MWEDLVFQLLNQEVSFYCSLALWSSCSIGTPIARGMLPCICPYGSWPGGTHTMDWWAKSSWCYIRLNSTVRLKLWAQALLLALLEPHLHIFQDWFKDSGTLQPEKYKSMQIKTIHSPMQVLENPFSEDIARANPFPLATEEYTNLILQQQLHLTGEVGQKYSFWLGSHFPWQLHTKCKCLVYSQLGLYRRKSKIYDSCFWLIHKISSFLKNSLQCLPGFVPR